MNHPGKVKNDVMLIWVLKDEQEFSKQMNKDKGKNIYKHKNHIIFEELQQVMMSEPELRWSSIVKEKW